MPQQQKRLYADPVKWIFTQTDEGKIKVGVIFRWNNGEETDHLVRDIPLTARLYIEPITNAEIEAAQAHVR